MLKTPSTLESVTLDSVRAAAARLAGQVLDTPCLESRTLGEILGARIFLKFENLQFTASFKERGALNKLLSLRERRQPLRGVIAASAGNHAQGLAHHAQRLGLRAVIVMPELTPVVKVERTRGFGAEVLLHGQTFDESHEHALRLARQQELELVHPFDDAEIIAGQGTIALEMLSAQPSIDTLVVAVGGGGLLSGMATVVRALRPDIRIIGVQSARFASMVNAVTGSTHPIGTTSIAEGIAVGRPGKLTRAIAGALVDEWMIVDEGDIEQAILMLLEIEKTVVEGAGAASLAALLTQPTRLAGRHVGMVLCGGNIDPLRLQALIGRGMVRAGRLARVRVEAQDIPGALARVTSVVAQCGANIEEVHHQRAFSALPMHHVALEFVLQTRNHAHVESVIRALRDQGLKATDG
ncbi:MAG: threonine ammonia-lyase [Rubrivivax sp.]